MHQVHALVQKICRGIGSPAAMGVLSMVDKGEWLQLQQLKTSPPETYVSARTYRDDLLVTEFVRKLAIPGRTAVKRAAAVKTFYEAEAQCFRTNAYFTHLESGHLTENDTAVNEFITRWRAIIRSVLGPLPVRLYPRYSPGSTLSDQGMQITIPDKMSSLATCYPHSVSVVEHTREGTELDGPRRPSIRRANKFFTVPKDGSKDRGCCVEASLNVTAQLDVGRHIKARYSRYYKVDLPSAQHLHRLAAKLASEGAAYSTIDLSNASDTVAHKLVKAVLPSNWYMLLESLRARYTKIEGKDVYLQKFSSMGNGFTFELETLLFRTLAEAIGVERDDALVYGDDIIVPSRHSRAMLAALQCFGFTPNARKTFCEGPFRESCGGDFFLGTDVRAVYLKELPDEPQKWIILHNQLKRWDHEERLRAARWFCIDQVPSNWRNFGPVAEHNMWFHTDDPTPIAHRGKPRQTRRLGLTPTTLGYWGWEAIPKRITVSTKWFREVVVRACATLGTGEMIALRDTVAGYEPVFVPAVGLTDKQLRQRFPGLISLVGLRKE